DVGAFEDVPCPNLRIDTGRGNDRTVLRVQAPHEFCSGFSSSHFREPRTAGLDRRRSVRDVRAKAEIAWRANVDTEVQPESRDGLSVARDDGILLDDIEGPGDHAGIGRKEQWCRPDRPIQ